MKIYLVLYNKETNKQFLKYFDTEFEKDKFKRKLKYLTNNQPDYKSAWNELKTKYIEYIDEYYNLFEDINELEQKYNLGGE